MQKPYPHSSQLSRTMGAAVLVVGIACTPCVFARETTRPAGEADQGNDDDLALPLRRPDSSPAPIARHTKPHQSAGHYSRTTATASAEDGGGSRNLPAEVITNGLADSKKDEDEEWRTELRCWLRSQCETHWKVVLAIGVGLFILTLLSKYRMVLIASLGVLLLLALVGAIAVAFVPTQIVTAIATVAAVLTAAVTTVIVQIRRVKKATRRGSRRSL
jgi:hypothetical protein